MASMVRGFTSWLRLGSLGFPDEGEDLTVKVRELSGWLDMFRLEFRKLDLVTEVRGPRECSCVTGCWVGIVCTE